MLPLNIYIGQEEKIQGVGGVRRVRSRLKIRLRSQHGSRSSHTQRQAIQLRSVQLCR
jgi:hypothetical protein